MVQVDKLCYQSNLRYINPTEKFVYSILTLLFCILSRSIIMGIVVFILNWFLNVKVGGVSGRRYKTLILIPFSFMIISTLTILINISHRPLDAFAIPIGSFYLTSSYAGLLKGIQLIVTAIASVSCLYFLSLNTTMTDIIEVNRKLHVPELILELMVLIYRFTFVLLDVAFSITVAQNSRLGNITYKTAIKSFSGMIQVLFIRAMKRAKALYDAMEARCYTGTLKVLSDYMPAKKNEIALIAGFEFFLLAWTICIKVLHAGGIY